MWKTVLLLTGLMAGSSLLYAESSSATRAAEENLTEENKGLAVAREAERRGEGFGDLQARMRMELMGRRGDTSERELRVLTLEMDNEDEDSRSLLIFDTPRDVRGTALLTWSYKTRDDDQWLYLPALRGVRTIASRNRSGPFMGSEFTFEDLSTQPVEKYTYNYLREESCGELQCHVIERFPTDPNSGYIRQVVWIDQDEYRTWKVDYHDRKESHLKTLRLSDYQLHNDRFWRAGKMAMVNHQTGRGTTLYWENFQFDTGLTEDDFTRNSLMRAR